MLVPSSAVRRFACAVAVLAVTVAGCSGSGGPGLDGAAEAVGTTGPVETLQSQLDTLASTYEMDPDTDVSIAALDTVTGQSMQYGSSSGMVAASAGRRRSSSPLCWTTKTRAHRSATPTTCEPLR